MKNYVYCIILSAIIVIVSLFGAIILDSFNLDFCANIAIGVFASALLICVTSIISYKISKKNKLKKLMAYCTYLQVMIKTLDIYYRKYDRDQVFEKSYAILQKVEELQVKFDEITDDVYFFNKSANRLIESIGHKIREMYLSLVDFCEIEEKKEFSVAGWVLYVKNKLKISDEIDSMFKIFKVKNKDCCRKARYEQMLLDSLNNIEDCEDKLYKIKNMVNEKDVD